ncbi:MAG TPA: hypothetical protein VKW76_01455 [Candidatus Binatia bacterium]|nr:hypothetical protein [Candidatus Binatia bacterium]
MRRWAVALVMLALLAPAAGASAQGTLPSYGLVQLRGVPDGARVDLDGRFWLEADGLDTRWLVVPRGPHRLTVHVPDHEPVERRVDVVDGRTQVVRIGSAAGKQRAR